MADWAKRNFEDMDDRSPAEVPMRWLFSRGVVRSTETGVSRFSYEPGARMPFGHRHTTQQEVYVVTARCKSGVEHALVHRQCDRSSTGARTYQGAWPTAS